VIGIPKRSGRKGGGREGIDHKENEEAGMEYPFNGHKKKLKEVLASGAYKWKVSPEKEKTETPGGLKM